MGTKLELTWPGKENRPRLEPRILVEEPELSYHAKERVTEGDAFDNVLIQGDNLLALKALQSQFDGKVKCIYIDPPYNTGQAFEHYDDGLEHSTWLAMMRDRLEQLQPLLASDGVLVCQLNDEEMAHAKVLMDELLGRSNFLNLISVKMKQSSGASGGGEDKRLKKNIEYLLVYARDRNGEKGFQRFNDLFEETDLFEVIEDMKAEGKSWKYTRALVSTGSRTFLKETLDGSGDPIRIYIHTGVEIKTIAELAVSNSISEEECYFKFFDSIFRDTNAQSSIRTRVMEAVSGQGDFFSIDYKPRSGKNKGNSITQYYKGRNCDLLAWLKDVAKKKGNRVVKLEKIGTYWEGFPLNNLTKEGGVFFPKGKKPEALLRKVIELCTNESDWVLDSFAGSGTTGAVAHKLARRWIMVESGNHAITHIVPRMRKVADGTDQGGISKSVSWKGGGGFRFYRLAPSLLKEDRWGNYVINPVYNAEMLAHAVCLHEGFVYAPSETEFWMHGRANENSYLFVTTQHLTPEQLQALSDEVGPNRSLRVLCTAFSGSAAGFDNLEVRKIPSEILGRCEWDHDDYSLQVANLPMREEKPPEKPASSKRAKPGETLDLFGAEDDL